MLKTLTLAFLAVGALTVIRIQPAAAGSCTYVGVTASGARVPGVSATGHGPRGCIRAKRRCLRRLNVPGGTCVGVVIFDSTVIR
jgi:hypothetical protein